jgi:hypothetical protein
MAPVEVRVAPLFSKGLGVFFPYGLNKPLKSQTLESQTIVNAFDACCLVNSNTQRKIHSVKVALGMPSEATSLVKSIADNLPKNRLLHIERSDEIARLASHKVAKFSRIWHVESGSSLKNSNPRLWISPLSLTHSYIMSRKANAILASAAAEPGNMHINYEEFANNNESVYNDICSWLGIESEWVQDSGFRKRLADPSEFVVNYQKLNRLLSDLRSQFERMKDISFSRVQYKRLKLASIQERLIFRYLNRA